MTKKKDKADLMGVFEPEMDVLGIIQTRDEYNEIIKPDETEHQSDYSVRKTVKNAKRIAIKVRKNRNGKYNMLTLAQKLFIAKMAQQKIVVVNQKGLFCAGTFRGRIAGRKPGCRNKYKCVRDILKSIGCEPILIMARMAMNKKASPGLRVTCAKELASYCHGKVRMVDPLDSLDSTERKQFTFVIEGAPIPGFKDDFSDALPSEESAGIIDITPDECSDGGSCDEDGCGDEDGCVYDEDGDNEYSEDDGLDNDG